MSYKTHYEASDVEGDDSTDTHSDDDDDEADDGMDSSDDVYSDELVHTQSGVFITVFNVIQNLSLYRRLGSLFTVFVESDILTLNRIFSAVISLV